MQPALDALDRGVQQLFSRPPRHRSLLHDHQHHRLPQTSSSSSSRSASPQAHPLCECLALQQVPDDWQHLRRHPVLKRYVLSRWQELCDQYDHTYSQQQQVKLATPTLSSSVSAVYARSRAVVVQSVKSLCVLLYQCGLLHVREIEFVRLLVSHTLAHGLGDVLLAARENHTGDLPLRVRMLLLNVALEKIVLKRSGNETDEDNSLLKSDTAKQRLVEDLCTSLQEEVLEAMTNNSNKKIRARAFAGGGGGDNSDTEKSTGATPRRAHATSKRKTPRRRELTSNSNSSSAFAPQCAFCSHSEDLSSSLSAAASKTPWEELQRLLSTIRGQLTGIESGRLLSDMNSKPVALKLAALRNLLLRSDVTLRLATRESAEHHRQQNQSLFHRGAIKQWSMSVAQYRQTRWSSLYQKDCAAASDVNMVLWGTVWEKELLRFSSSAKHVYAHEVIVHCAKADFFARILSAVSSRLSRSFNNDDTASLPGYRLVCQVLRALQVDCFSAILLFLQAWTSIASLGMLGFTTSVGCYQGQAFASRTRATLASNSIAGVCRSYLMQLLSEGEQWVPWSQNVKKSPDGEAVNGEQLVKLLHSLFTIFADAFCGAVAADGSQWPSYCRLWDRVLQLSQPGDARDDAGWSWLNGLILCYDKLDSTTSSHSHSSQDDAFKTAFTRYMLRVLCAIIVENGKKSISSGNGSSRRPLVRSEDDLNFVREAVTSILVTFAVTEQAERKLSCQFTSKLIIQLLQSQMHSHFRAWSLEATLRYQRGLDQIFFPALASYIRALSKNPSGNAQAKAKVIEEEHFGMLLVQVTERLKATHGYQAVAIAMLGFCTNWDAFQFKTRGTNANSRQATKRWLWGRASFLKLQLFPDILRIYESESVLKQERDDVLQFLGDVLQSVTNCPPVLEGKLFQLLTGIKSRLDSHHSADGVPIPPIDANQQQEDDEELPLPPLIPVAGVKRTSLILPSSDSLALFVHQLHTGTILQVREAVEKVKSDPLQLEELLGHVLRWIALLELHGPRVAPAFGKETKLSFAVLCNRLMCWLPDECIREIRQAVTPIDQELAQALTMFAEGYGSSMQDESDDVLSMNGGSTVTTGSSVRLELLIRSFVYSSVVPDLCELTDIIVNATIGCTSTKSRDALLKLTQRISSVLLVEVAIETLRVSLSTECLSYLDKQANHNVEDDDEENENGPSGGSINRVSNALSIVGLSASLFGCNDISWSASLFDEQAVQHWLLCFFDCMVYSEQSRTLTPIDELLSSLEFLVQTPQGAHMVAHSYLLVALLCTASFPQSRIPRAQWSDFDTSLLEITQALLGALSPPVSAEGAEGNGDNEPCEVLVARVEPLYVARAKVSEEKLELATKVLPVQASSALVNRLQNGYLSEDDGQENADPGYRVFVCFSTWLPSAIIYSQTIAAVLTSSSSTGGEEHSWEQLFVDNMVYLYLPLEFESNLSRLLKTWITVWMRLNLESAGGELLLLLPFQQKLFSRLSATSHLQSHQTRRETVSEFSDPVWKLVFTCVHSVLESVVVNPDGSDAAIVVLDDVMDKFDLVNLSTMSSSSASHATSELLDKVEALCLHPSMALLTDIQAIHVLKYPLELIAFCHVTMPPSAEYLVISIELPAIPPQWKLERALKALQLSFHGPRDSGADNENDGKLSPEMSAFWYEWTQMIQLKLAFLDPIRCEQFITAATHALAGLEFE